jgi:hypothetical protein
MLAHSALVCPRPADVPAGGHLIISAPTETSPISRLTSRCLVCRPSHLCVVCVCRVGTPPARYNICPMCGHAYRMWTHVHTALPRGGRHQSQCHARASTLKIRKHIQYSYSCLPHRQTDRQTDRQNRGYVRVAVAYESCSTVYYVKPLTILSVCLPHKQAKSCRTHRKILTRAKLSVP